MLLAIHTWNLSLSMRQDGPQSGIHLLGVWEVAAYVGVDHDRAITQREMPFNRCSVRLDYPDCMSSPIGAAVLSTHTTREIILGAHFPRFACSLDLSVRLHS